MRTCITNLGNNRYIWEVFSNGKRVARGEGKSYANARAQAETAILRMEGGR